jgi:hypothetical protein
MGRPTDLELLERILRARPCEKSWLAFRDRSENSREDDVHSLTAELGLHDVGGYRIDREMAHRVILRTVGQSLIDPRFRAIPGVDSEAFADEFLATFSPDATFLCNVKTEGPLAWMVYGGSTIFTFDMGLVAADDATVGLVVVAEED